MAVVQSSAGPILRRGFGILAPLAPDADARSPQELVTQVQDLTALYGQGVRRIVVVRVADMPGKAPVSGFAPGALRGFRKLLLSRGLAPVTVSVAGADSPAVADYAAHLAEHAQLRGRRDIMRALMPDEGGDTPGQALRALQQVNADHSGAIFTVAPVIAAQDCTGCDACLRVCPCDVLTQINDSPAQISYRVDPAACDGCQLCEHVCDMGAINLATFLSRPRDIPLRPSVCVACGVAMHMPQAHPDANGLCDICRRTGHHKKLFQVLA